MRRHVIIGRFGPDDKTRVPKARDEVASTLTFDDTAPSLPNSEKLPIG